MDVRLRRYEPADLDAELRDDAGDDIDSEAKPRKRRTTTRFVNQDEEDVESGMAVATLEPGEEPVAIMACGGAGAKATAEFYRGHANIPPRGPLDEPFEPSPRPRPRSAPGRPPAPARR